MIQRMQLKNFKSFEYLDIEFSDLNIFSGSNSIGKSSIIQALLLLKENEREIFQATPEIKNNKPPKSQYFNENRTYQPIKTLNVNGVYVQLGQEEALLYMNASDEQIKIEARFDESNYIDLMKTGRDECWQTSTFLRGRNGIYSDNTKEQKLHYLNTHRVAPAITYPLSNYDISINRIGHYGEHCAHYLAVNKNNQLNIDSLKHPESSTPFLLENVSKWLAEISSGIDVTAKVIPEANLATLTYSYGYGLKKTREITPLHVGFGVTHALPVVTQLLISKPGDLLIIENPEAHLHPKGQAQLAKLIALTARHGVQVIIETHSDHILNAIRVATKEQVITPEQSKIYFFTRTENSLATQTTEICIEPDGSVSQWPEGFFDEWDNQLDKLIW